MIGPEDSVLRAEGLKSDRFGDALKFFELGELQSIYEHITFTRSNHPQKFEGIIRQVVVDLEANLIPLPQIPD